MRTFRLSSIVSLYGAGAVAGLAGRQRTALELHQFADHTYAEVAAELDMTPKAAKSLLYRARNQLRASLARFAKSSAVSGSNCDRDKGSRH